MAASTSKHRKKLSVKEVLDALDGNDSEFDISNDEDSENEDLSFEYLPSQDQADSSDDNSTGTSSGCETDNTEDDLPLSNFVGPKKKGGKQKTKKKTYKWQKKEFHSPNAEFTGPAYSDVTEIDSPYKYFTRFFTSAMVEMIVANSNIYSVEKTGKCVNTNVKEIEQLVGIFFRMGIVQMPGIRVYWENETRYGPVADVMSRNRFQLLLTTLHFVNNNDVTEEEKKNSKLWKIAPLLELFRTQCVQAVPEEHNAVDEMMVSFRGRFSSIKQYIRGKPNPWGLKIWARCGVSGFLYDFEVYQGKEIGRQITDLGVGGDVVVKLCKSLPENQNFKIYADNLFSSVKLVEALMNRGFQYIGTLRGNRLADSKLMSGKDMVKKGRGTYDWKVEELSNIVVVGWLDTKRVNLISSYAGVEPTDKARRWDKVKKEFLEVTRPSIVSKYNSNMGGVDLLDACIARYKFHIISRRWYLYLFWQFVYIALVNAWFLYRRECQNAGINKNAILNQRKFQAIVAQTLIEVNAKKAGRPTTPVISPSARRQQKRPLANDDVRLDEVAHWPLKVEKRRRCAICEVNKTDTICEKCNTTLCFTEKRNCFKEYHRK